VKNELVKLCEHCKKRTQCFTQFSPAQKLNVLNSVCQVYHFLTNALEKPSNERPVIHLSLQKILDIILHAPKRLITKVGNISELNDLRIG
jgi:hypothetical protein